MSPSHTIILFYKYYPVADPQAVAAWHEQLCQKLGLNGRLIVAPEGINGTFEGKTDAIDTYIAELTAQPHCSDIDFKKSIGDGASFPWLSVKVRDEIVSGHLGARDINPTQKTGKRLSPDELHAWFSEGKQFTIVDMRNDYEYQVGHFTHSLASGMRNFRDLPTVPKKIIAEKTADVLSRPIVTVCTGGVRCEKASGYLVSQGFDDVYQLDGGIVSYMEKYPGKNFDGSLYVFDQRVTMHFNDPTTHTVIGACSFCGRSCERYINCKDDVCHAHFICCTDCGATDMSRFCVDCAKRVTVV